MNRRREMTSRIRMTNCVVCTYFRGRVVHGVNPSFGHARGHPMSVRPVRGFSGPMTYMSPTRFMQSQRTGQRTCTETTTLIGLRRRIRLSDGRWPAAAAGGRPVCRRYGGSQNDNKRLPVNRRPNFSRPTKTARLAARNRIDCYRHYYLALYQ